MKRFVSLAAICVVWLTACSASDARPAGSQPATSRDSVTPTPSASVSPVTPSGSGSPSAAPTGSPSSVAGPSDGGCKDKAATLEKPGFIRPGSLRGDVDGDGRADSVLIALDPAGIAGCQAFVVLRTASGTRVAAAIPQWESTPVLSAPHLRSLTQIDAAAGGEVVIDVAAGASTQFEGVYTYSDGSLFPLRVKGAPFSGLFAYGGSVGHLDGEACTHRDKVVISSATAKGPTGARYKVVRRFFRPATGTLDYVRHRTQRRLLRLSLLPRLPEFSGPPFAGCPST